MKRKALEKSFAENNIMRVASQSLSMQRQNAWATQKLLPNLTMQKD